MAVHSFFVDPGIIRLGRAELRGQIAHQIAKVLRLQQGEAIELLDGSGFVFPARIVAVSKSSVTVEILECRLRETEPGVELVLYQALLKGQKFEWVLQKGTEIGISRFVPVLSERCVSRPSAGDIQRKAERWADIVKEAAEQSKRTVIPQVAAALSFEDACREAGGMEISIMAWEEETAHGIRALLRGSGAGYKTQGTREQLSAISYQPSALSSKPQSLSTQHPALSTQHPEQDAGHRTQDSALDSQNPEPRTQNRPQHSVMVALLVGPEGGFSEREAEIARKAGVSLVSLGPRILRAETAALVATTAVLYEMGDLGG